MPEKNKLKNLNEYEKFENNRTDELVLNSQIFDNTDSTQDCSRDYELACLLSEDPDCSNDVELAMKLQREFDREIELNEKFRQSKEKSGVAKATLSVDSYYYLRNIDEDSSENDDNDEDGMQEFATNLLYEKIEFPPCGFIRNNDGTLITKHDININERKNVIKAMELPFNFNTGDFSDGRLSDKVLNDLRHCHKAENKKNVRIKDKDEKANSSLSIDANSRLILFNWINQGYFDRVQGIIAVGKESTVLHAILDKKDKSNDQLINNIADLPTPTTTEQDYGTGFAIKIYKNSLAGFKNCSEYVKDDFRFKNIRRVMKIWAEKEFINLNRLRRANILCPTPIRLKKNVLLMSLIGNNNEFAKKLKYADLSSDELKESCFLQIKQIISQMFNVCKLVHGDLSEFNLLLNNDIIYVIDVAQAMDISHPRSLVFLLKDIHNILNFFKNIGLKTIPTAYDLFCEITNITVFDPNDDLIVQVELFELENRNVNLRNDKAHPADMELRLYNSENSTNRSNSPARLFN